MELLKAADKALKAADPGSKTILAGLPNESWKALEAIYDAGARGAFDVVALHPYTGKPKNVVRIVKIVAARDGAQQGSASCRSGSPSCRGRRPRARPSRKATSRPPTPGQARRLDEGLKLLAERPQALRIERVYWYTWLSAEGITGSAFDYSRAAPAARRRS